MATTPGRGKYAQLPLGRPQGQATRTAVSADPVLAGRVRRPRLAAI